VMVPLCLFQLSIRAMLTDKVINKMKRIEAILHDEGSLIHRLCENA